MTMKYNPIGTTFMEGDVTLTPKESRDGGRTCNGCWYNSYTKDRRTYGSSCYVHGHACTPINRKDRKQVIFVKV